MPEEISKKEAIGFIVLNIDRFDIMTLQELANKVNNEYDTDYEYGVTVRDD